MTTRVLMLSWEYPPHHVGGLGRHVYHLSQALSNLDCEVTVLTRSPDGESAIFDDEGVEVIAAPSYGLHPPDFPTWAAEFNVSLLETACKTLSSSDFDVIHAHDWIVAYAARALPRLWGVPLVATIHATEHGRQNGIHTPSQGHISETEWWLCYHASRVITCSSYMKDEVSRVFGVPNDKVRVIPNGISDEWFSVQREPSRSPLVIFVGRLVREKGPHILVEAMAEVLAEFPSAQLVLAGDGPIEGDIRRMVMGAGMGSIVTLAGRQDDEGLRKLYSEAWVAVFPSSYEPFGIVALEAMATGVPCVVGSAGGLAEIVLDGQTGLLVPPGNPHALAEAIRMILRNNEWATDLAESARRRARLHYRWDDIAKETLHVYDELTLRKESLVSAAPGILRAR